MKSSPIQAEFVSPVFPSFLGKFKFQEEIDLIPDKRDTTMAKDIFYPEDDGADSLDIHGLELIVDYASSVKYHPYYPHASQLFDHYPVYFVNSTNTDKVFFGKDSYVFGIQEAVKREPYSQWRPIEGRGFDFCGNGRWGIIVHPQEFVLVLMRKYTGDYETELRVRFAVGENILVSRPFKGFINKSQFAIQDSSYLMQSLEQCEGQAVSCLFYGAVPEKEE